MNELSRNDNEETNHFIKLLTNCLQKFSVVSNHITNASFMRPEQLLQ